MCLDFTPLKVVTLDLGNGGFTLISDEYLRSDICVWPCQAISKGDTVIVLYFEPAGQDLLSTSGVSYLNTV